MAGEGSTDSRLHGAVLYGAGLGPIRGRSARGHAACNAAQFRHGESVLLGRVQSVRTMTMSLRMKKTRSEEVMRAFQSQFGWFAPLSLAMLFAACDQGD